MLRWVVSEKHDYQHLVLRHFQSSDQEVCQVAAEVAVPGFQPGGDICQDSLRLLVFCALLFHEWLEQWWYVCGQEEFVKVNILTSVDFSADP